MQTPGPPLEIQKLAVGACGRVANGRRDPKADTPMWMRTRKTLDQGQADGSLAPEAAVQGFHSRRERLKIAKVLLTVKDLNLAAVSQNVFASARILRDRQADLRVLPRSGRRLAS